MEKKRRKTSITTKNVKSNIEKNEKENKRKVKHEGKNVEKRREEKIFGKKEVPPESNKQECVP